VCQPSIIANPIGLSDRHYFRLGGMNAESQSLSDQDVIHKLGQGLHEWPERGELSNDV
jgi:hypothetical protein